MRAILHQVKDSLDRRLKIIGTIFDNSLLFLCSAPCNEILILARTAEGYNKPRLCYDYYKFEQGLVL